MSNELKINDRDYEADTTDKEEKSALEKYRDRERKKQEELLKGWQEERAEVLKQQEAPKPKKSKIKSLFTKIVETLKDKNFLDSVLFIVYILWFGFVGRIIIVSELHIIVKILMIIGDLWWGLYVMFSLHSNFK